jgi:hypothetical protein
LVQRFGPYKRSFQDQSAGGFFGGIGCLRVANCTGLKEGILMQLINFSRLRGWLFWLIMFGFVFAVGLLKEIIKWLSSNF